MQAEDGQVAAVTGSRQAAAADADGAVAKLAHSSLAGSLSFALQPCPTVHDPKRVSGFSAIMSIMCAYPARAAAHLITPQLLPKSGSCNDNDNATAS